MRKNLSCTLGKSTKHLRFIKVFVWRNCNGGGVQKVAKCMPGGGNPNHDVQTSPFQWGSRPGKVNQSASSRGLTVMQILKYGSEVRWPDVPVFQNRPVFELNITTSQKNSVCCFFPVLRNVWCKLSFTFLNYFHDDVRNLNEKCS